MYTKQDLARIYSLKRFFTSYFIDVDTFLFVSELVLYAFSLRSEIRLLSQATRVYKYTKIQRPRFQKNYIIVRDQKSNLYGTSFQSSPKMNRMLITRSIRTQGKFTTPDHRNFAN